MKHLLLAALILVAIFSTAVNTEKTKDQEIAALKTELEKAKELNEMCSGDGSGDSDGGGDGGGGGSSGGGGFSVSQAESAVWGHSEGGMCEECPLKVVYLNQSQVSQGEKSGRVEDEFRGNFGELLNDINGKIITAGGNRSLNDSMQVKDRTGRPILLVPQEECPSQIGKQCTLSVKSSYEQNGQPNGRPREDALPPALQPKTGIRGQTYLNRVTGEWVNIGGKGGDDGSVCPRYEPPGPGGPFPQTCTCGK